MQAYRRIKVPCLPKWSPRRTGKKTQNMQEKKECQFSLGDPVFIGYVVQTAYFPGYSLKLCFSYWVIVWIFSGHCPTTQKPSFSSQDIKNNTLSQGKINSDKYPHLPAVWGFSHSMALPQTRHITNFELKQESLQSPKVKWKKEQLVWLLHCSSSSNCSTFCSALAEQTFVDWRWNGTTFAQVTFARLQGQITEATMKSIHWLAVHWKSLLIQQELHHLRLKEINVPSYCYSLNLQNADGYWRSITELTYETFSYLTL